MEWHRNSSSSYKKDTTHQQKNEDFNPRVFYKTSELFLHMLTPELCKYCVQRLPSAPEVPLCRTSPSDSPEPPMPQAPLAFPTLFVL